MSRREGSHRKLGVGLRLMRHRPAAASIAFLAVSGTLYLVGPIVAQRLGIDPMAIDASHRYQGPSLDHWLGTDDLGRDFFTRLLLGGRISLSVAFLAAMASVGLGAAIGLSAGYKGGMIDAIAMRVTEGIMALPKLPLMILMTAVDLEKILPWPALARGELASILKLVFIIIGFGWAGTARLARALALQLREAEFVLAARGLGASDRHILVTHILPHAAAPLIVAATLDIGEVLLYESVLSFLGLGVQPPAPSWGAMIQNGMTYLYRAPRLVLVPGILTFLTVAAVNFVGEALRDAMDPRSS